MSRPLVIRSAIEIPVTGSERPMLVDAEDAHQFDGFELWLHTKGYALRKLSMKTAGTFAHVVIFGEAPVGFVVDHKNGDRLDNRRSNLRLATLSQNAANQRRSVRSKSGYIGVTQSGKASWRASIHVGTNRVIGYFATPEEAARARDRAALEEWGEFATLNFPYETQEETPTLAGVEASEDENV